MTTLTNHSKPDRYTRESLIEYWRELHDEHRLSERSNRRHANEDLAKWHEGKADAFDRCADMLEFLFVVTPKTSETTNPRSNETP